MSNVQIITVDPRKLKHLPTKNPNVMEPHVFEALCESIRTDGFLQPLLVVQEGNDTVLIDGVHRSKAASKVGLKQVHAVLAPDRARAEVLRIALNKMRGELDLTEVGHQMQLLIDSGLTEDDLTLTGFASWEIEALLESTADLDETDLDGADITPPAPEKPKTYNLTIKFQSESDRAAVRDAMQQTGEETPDQQLLELVAHALPVLGEGDDR